jgi:lactoylglutathione lyase
MLSSSFPIVYVDDLRASLRFYVDLLGFEEIYRFPPSGEPGYASLTLGADKLGLSSADYPGRHGKPQRPVTGRPFELCVEAADVDAFIATVRERGAPILAEPEDQPWGERVAYLEDPDGNPVHVRGPAPSG